jgi:casein kinase II subunit alpha
MDSPIDTNKSRKDFKSSHFRKNVIQMSSSPIYSRIYKDVNEQKGANYYNYEDLEVQWSDENNYEITKKIGRGKYSEVFEGNSILNKQKCVVKILKPIKYVKILREIKILQNLSGQKNIIQLLDVTRDSELKTPSLIFEHVENVPFRELYPSLNKSELSYYTDQLLIAANSCHSNGIMHRDIKPHNIVINHEKKQLKLIDFGLAEFYHPSGMWNIRVASRYFKAPELLIYPQDGTKIHYDYSMDMWSIGCTVAQMMFKKDPFFRGKDNTHQLYAIIKKLGKDDLYTYLQKYRIPLKGYPYLDEINKNNLIKRSFHEYTKPENVHLTSADGIDFIEKLLVYDPQERMTVREAMCHKWFRQIPNRNLAERGIDPNNPNV